MIDRELTFCTCFFDTRAIFMDYLTMPTRPSPLQDERTFKGLWILLHQYLLPSQICILYMTLQFQMHTNNTQ